MKPDIHPKYFKAKVHCGSCGTEFEVGSTRPELRVDVCSSCHPFFTGRQTIIDTAGQVERFQKRLERRARVAAEPVVAAAPARATAERATAEPATAEPMTAESAPEPEAEPAEPEPARPEPAEPAEPAEAIAPTS